MLASSLFVAVLQAALPSRRLWFPPLFFASPRPGIALADSAKSLKLVVRSKCSSLCWPPNELLTRTLPRCEGRSDCSSPQSATRWNGRMPPGFSTTKLRERLGANCSHPTNTSSKKSYMCSSGIRRPALIPRLRSTVIASHWPLLRYAMRKPSVRRWTSILPTLSAQRSSLSAEFDRARDSHQRTADDEPPSLAGLTDAGHERTRDS